MLASVARTGQGGRAARGHAAPPASAPRSRRTIGEEVFENLDAPVVRLAAPDTPVPFSPPLEQRFIPQVDDVLAAIHKLYAY